jgi:tetratricopeptide (TPR) repeat protein
MLPFVHRDPGNAPAFNAQNHGIVGEMFLQAGRPQEAAEEFRAAIAMLEDYPGDSTGDQYRRVIDSSRFGIALARQDGAVVSDEEVLSRLRDARGATDLDLRHDVLSMLGGLLMARGDAAGAADALAGAVSADPNNLDTLLRLAEAQHKAGRSDEALATAAKALSAFPDADPKALASAHYGQALIYLDRSDPALAESHLREVLRLDPEHPRAEWIRARLGKDP